MNKTNLNGRKPTKLSTLIMNGFSHKNTHSFTIQTASNNKYRHLCSKRVLFGLHLRSTVDLFALHFNSKININEKWWGKEKAHHKPCKERCKEVTGVIRWQFATICTNGVIIVSQRLLSTWRRRRRLHWHLDFHGMDSANGNAGISSIINKLKCWRSIVVKDVFSYAAHSVQQIRRNFTSYVSRKCPLLYLRHPASNINNAG